MKIIWMSFGPIGDTLISLAFFDDILKLAPETRFSVLSSANAGVIRELSSAYPNIEVTQIPGLAGFLLFFLKLLREPATVIVPGVARHYSLKLKLFFWALRHRPGNRVLGFEDWSREKGWLPFNKRYRLDFSIPIIENYRRMIPDVFPGEKAPHTPPRVLLKPEKLPHFVLAPRSYIVVHMFGTRPRYSFPPKRWRLLLLELRKQFPGYQLILTGASKDRSLIEEVGVGVEGAHAFINEPILSVAWIIKHAALYIGVDTGISHMAAVLGQQSVVIGHNTDPMWLPSYNPNGVILTNNEHCLCRGDKSGDCVVYEDGVGYRRCTYDVTINEVCWAVAARLVR
jgi:heptosyltransferase III